MCLDIEGFVVISRSKLDPYQVDLLYIRVMNSSHNGFLRDLPRNKTFLKHSLCKFCRRQLVFIS